MLLTNRARAICCDQCKDWIHINSNSLDDIDYENLKTSSDI